LEKTLNWKNPRLEMQVQNPKCASELLNEEKACEYIMLDHQWHMTRKVQMSKHRNQSILLLLLPGLSS
jgi:hypothetical protein